VRCTGYRDTQKLRITDESKAVQRKVTSKQAPPAGQDVLWLPLSLEAQARDAFFMHYVAGTLTTWDFLKFHYPTNAAEHLALSIDAASLAYLSHETHSETALAIARKKYLSALRTTNKALQSPHLAAEEPTLLAALVLDLFEKITNADSNHNGAWKSHVNGALALVRLRGLDQFKKPSALKVLVRLSTNFVITSVASCDPVPDELVTLRAYVAKKLDSVDPKWQLTDLMIHYANLRSNMSRNIISAEDYVKASLKLEAQLQALSDGMPPSWCYQTTILDYDTARVYEHRVDTFLDRHITQTWNVIRLVRILLNQSTLQHCPRSDGNSLTESSLSWIERRRDTIAQLARDICASVPQYVDCHRTGRARFWVQGVTVVPEQDCKVSGGICQFFSASRLLNCYSLIFPLYIVGSSTSSTSNMKTWAIRQLRYMGEHYGIRKAELVARILEEGTETNPWTVYTVLGSYAFVA
jgi:hypothetical protein